MGTQEEEKLLQRTFSEVGRKLDSIIEKTKNAKKELREEVEEKVMRFRQEKERLETSLAQAKRNSMARWEQAKEHTVKATSELTKAVRAVLGKEQ